jgi:hypothetical protein
MFRAPRSGKESNSPALRSEKEKREGPLAGLGTDGEYRMDAGGHMDEMEPGKRPRPCLALAAALAARNGFSVVTGLFLLEAVSD